MDDMPGGYASEDNVRYSIHSMSEYSFHTPRAHPSSRRTSGRATPTTPTGPGDTPPRFEDDIHDRTPQGRDSNAAALDARHFTPNLHASLVSEILALRRELESKSLSVETLETNLQAAKSENEALQESVAKNSRESRAVKKQLESIETGTLSAIEGLCKERDEANDAKSELKRRLEESQNKVRTLDSETKRLNNVLANDKRHWENERVSLVRRMTVAENRLKAVVSEFAGAQAVAIHHAQELPVRRSVESATRDQVKSEESDDTRMSSSPQKNGHDRGKSSSSITTIGTNKRKNTTAAAAAPLGLSLADEINFEDEYEVVSDEAVSDTEMHKRHLSQSSVSSEKAHKVLGMVSQIETRNSAVSTRSNERAASPYKRQSILEPAFDSDQELPLRPPPDPPSDGRATLVVDTETTQELDPSLPAQIPSPGAVSVVSVSTQTEAEMPPRPSRDPPALPTSKVPCINVLDPDGGSEPKSPAMAIQSRNVACQTDFTTWSAPSRTASTQTELLQWDNKPPKLATTLLVSASENALSTSPLSSRQSESALQSFADTPATSYEDVQTAPAGKDDADGQDDGSWLRLKRALRPSGSSRPWTEATQDAANTGAGGGSAGGDGDDNNLVVPPIPRAHNRPMRPGKPSFDPPTPVPEDEKVGPSSATAPQSARQTNFATLFHQLGHSNSPSIGSAASSSNISKGSGPRPPFAVPPRHSSKSRSRRSWKRGGANVSPTRAGRVSPQARIQFGQDPVLRKVQSAVALAPNERNVSPDRPPVPIHSAVYRHYQDKSSRSQPFLQSYNLASPTATTTSSALATTSLQYSVVDAITATMIGEWMWKYVRKRKSFGVSEPAEPSKIADVRHRRWVWLSPYEKTIMWSSRQPTSNTALMGKPGRKLSIQSVLDVKDDTPLPKGADSEAGFGRSILVLTPARALKFTAPTKERHYLWLNALSFLAHHSASSEDPDLHLKPDGSSEVPSVHESKLALSSTTSIRGPLASMRSSMGRRSSRSSGQATPMFSPRESTLHERQDSDTLDSAFAPTVPRVPMHSRKRSATNPSRTRPALGNFSLSSPAAAGLTSSVSMLSAAPPSARGYSQSGTSSFRLDHARVDFDGPASWGHIPNIGEEVEPRASQASADFGGNTNFFDESGFVRMSAFVSPGVVGASAAPAAPAPARSGKQPTQLLAPLAQIGHGKGEGSKDSFIGPPNIGRFRGSKGRSFFSRSTQADEPKPAQGFLSADEA